MENVYSVQFLIYTIKTIIIMLEEATKRLLQVSELEKINGFLFLFLKNNEK